MFKRIDRYIIQRYLVTFFVSIFLILALAVVFDVSERLDGLMGKGDLKPKLKEIVFDYYLNFVIYFSNLFTPLFAFISVIFFTSRMASRLEIISILSTGTSYWRMLLPFITAAFMIASLNWVSANYLIPKANEAKLNFERKYFSRGSFSTMNVHRQISENEFVYTENFNYMNNTSSKLTYEKFIDGQLRVKIMCQSAVYDTAKQSWQLHDFIVREMNGLDENMRVGGTLDTNFAFTPEIFKTDLKKIITMSNTELDQFIKDEKAKGSKYVSTYLLEKHQRHANPFTVIIMTLLAVPIASRKVRGGIGFHLAMGVALAFTYIFLGRIFTTYAAKDVMDPFLATWMPNILYVGLAVVLVRFAQK